MNKSELVTYVANQTKLTKKEAEITINAVFAGIQDALTKGDNAAFIGFGTFKTTDREAREGINPRTKEAIKIPASKGVSFKAGKDLREAVNT